MLMLMMMMNIFNFTVHNIAWNDDFDTHYDQYCDHTITHLNDDFGTHYGRNMVLNNQNCSWNDGFDTYYDQYCDQIDDQDHTITIDNEFNDTCTTTSTTICTTIDNSTTTTGNQSPDEQVCTVIESQTIEAEAHDQSIEEKKDQSIIKLYTNTCIDTTINKGLYTTPMIYCWVIR